jgi:hypothetical protein
MISVAQATVTESARHRETTAHVRIAGDVDIAVEPALADAIDRLIALATPRRGGRPDLGDLLRGQPRQLPRASAQRHPRWRDPGRTPHSPAVRRVLEITGISALVSLR